MNGEIGGDVNAPGVVMTNGVMFIYQAHAYATCTLSEGDLCGTIRVDVNGFKGPNKVGKDIFAIGIRQSDIIPLGRPGKYYYNSHPCDPSVSSSRGGACAYKVLKGEDY